MWSTKLNHVKRKNSPLPPDFNSRTVSVEDQEPLDEEGTTLYRKEIMCIAWLVRTRPYIAAAVALMQTKFTTPNIIDRKDLSNMAFLLIAFYCIPRQYRRFIEMV